MSLSDFQGYIALTDTLTAQDCGCGEYRIYKETSTANVVIDTIYVKTRARREQALRRAILDAYCNEENLK